MTSRPPATRGQRVIERLRARNDRRRRLRASLQPARPSLDRFLRGLEVYFPLADATAVDLKDAVHGPGGPYALTNTGAVTRADGLGALLPDAASFVAASSQKLASDYVPDVSQGLTVLVWLKADDIGAIQRAFSCWGGGGERTFIYYVQDTAGAFQLQTSADGTNSEFLTSSAQSLYADWFHVGFRYDGATIQHLVNGAPDQSAARTLFQPVAAAPLTLGQFTGGAQQYYDGLMEQFLAWPRWLADDEVALLYNGGVGYDPRRSA